MAILFKWSYARSFYAANGSEKNERRKEARNVSQSESGREMFSGRCHRRHSILVQKHPLDGKMSALASTANNYS